MRILTLNVMKILLPLLVLVMLAFDHPAQEPWTRKLKLPEEAQIVEAQPIHARIKRDRAIVIWMINPSRFPRENPSEIYTCPEYTRGHYYSGPTRVSLVNTMTGQMINTINIIQEYSDDEDSFDLPYRIRAGYHYVVGARDRNGEGKPNLMAFRDYNGDGRELEFALYDALACMGLPTTLIGYSISKDKVVQYPVELRVEGENPSATKTHWVDYLFSKKPVKAGHWKYEIDYRGRGGSLDVYEIRYVPAEEKFVGTLVTKPGELAGLSRIQPRFVEAALFSASPLRALGLSRRLRTFTPE